MTEEVTIVGWSNLNKYYDSIENNTNIEYTDQYTEHREDNQENNIYVIQVQYKTN